MDDRGKARTLTFGTGDSSLGKFLVASSDKGIGAILFGASLSALLQELGATFPNLDFHAGERAFNHVIHKVEHLIEHPATKFDLPLDTSGGDLERLVLAAIRATCAGKTVSHADIARMIGATSASARYVAEVCAKNSIAVAIPCHRVAEADGSGPQYRWGEYLRHALLEREKAHLRERGSWFL